jgi:hypothetical protein
MVDQDRGFVTVPTAPSPPAGINPCENMLAEEPSTVLIDVARPRS